MALGNTLSELSVKINADTSNMKKGLKGAEKDVGVFGKKFSKGMKIAGAAVAGLGIAIAAFSIKAAVDMGKLYTKIAAGTGKTGKELDKLKKSFKKVAGSVSLDMESVADVITELNTRIGLTGEPLEIMAKKIAEVARMLGVDATRATIEFTQALNRWEVPAEEAPLLLDKLFVASQNTGIAIDKLSSLMGEYGSVLKNAKWPLEDTIALFASFEKEGLDISRVMPALNMAFRKWAEEGVIDLKGALEKAIVQIRDATTTSEALAIATGIFGAEGAQRLTDAIRSGDDSLIGGLTELSKILNESEGAVNKFAEETDDAANKMTILKNKINIVAADIGEAFLPAIEKITRRLGPTIDKLSRFIENNTALTASLIQVMIAIGGVMLFAGPILSFFRLMGKIVQGVVWVFKGLAVVIAGISLPLTALIALIAAFIATIGFMVWVIVSARHQIVKDLKAAWGAVQGFFVNIGGRIKDVAGMIWDKMVWIKDKIIKIWGKVIDFFKSIPDKIKGAMNRLKDILLKPIKFILDKLNRFFDIIRDFSWHFSGWNVAGVQIIPSFTFEPFKWLPHLPSLAEGGIVTKPTLALLGEHGAEAVVPLDRGMQPITITIVNEGPWFIREEDDIERIANALGDRFERKLRLLGV